MMFNKSDDVDERGRAFASRFIYIEYTSNFKIKNHVVIIYVYFMN
jgi:hypothetical protein